MRSVTDWAPRRKSCVPRKCVCGLRLLTEPAPADAQVRYGDDVDVDVGDDGDEDVAVDVADIVVAAIWRAAPSFKTMTGLWRAPWKVPKRSVRFLPGPRNDRVKFRIDTYV